MKNQYYLHLSSPCGKLNIFTHIYTYLTFTSAKHLDTPGESTVKHIFLSSRLPPAVDFASWESIEAQCLGSMVFPLFQLLDQGMVHDGATNVERMQLLKNIFNST